MKTFTAKIIQFVRDAVGNWKSVNQIDSRIILMSSVKTIIRLKNMCLT